MRRRRRPPLGCAAAHRRVCGRFFPGAGGGALGRPRAAGGADLGRYPAGRWRSERLTHRGPRRTAPERFRRRPQLHVGADLPLRPAGGAGGARADAGAGLCLPLRTGAARYPHYRRPGRSRYRHPRAHRAGDRLRRSHRPRGPPAPPPRRASVPARRARDSHLRGGRPLRGLRPGFRPTAWRRVDRGGPRQPLLLRLPRRRRRHRAPQAVGEGCQHLRTEIYCRLLA